MDRAGKEQGTWLEKAQGPGLERRNGAGAGAIGHEVRVGRALSSRRGKGAGDRASKAEWHRGRGWKGGKAPGLWPWEHEVGVACFPLAAGKAPGTGTGKAEWRRGWGHGTGRRALSSRRRVSLTELSTYANGGKAAHGGAEKAAVPRAGVHGRRRADRHGCGKTTTTMSVTTTCAGDERGAADGAQIERD